MGSLMARRSFNVVDVTEILIHWHAGRSQSEIATSLGVDRKTVKKYLTPAIEAGVVPGDGPRSGEADRAGSFVVAGAGQHAVTADDVAADRSPSPVRRGHARRRGHAADDLAAAARRTRAHGVG